LGVKLRSATQDLSNESSHRCGIKVTEAKADTTDAKGKKNAAVTVEDEETALSKAAKDR
jgi:hypothetical protein